MAFNDWLARQLGMMTGTPLPAPPLPTMPGGSPLPLPFGLPGPAMPTPAVRPAPGAELGALRALLAQGVPGMTGPPIQGPPAPAFSQDALRGFLSAMQDAGANTSRPVPPSMRTPFGTITPGIDNTWNPPAGPMPSPNVVAAQMASGPSGPIAGSAEAPMDVLDVERIMSQYLADQANQRILANASQAGGSVDPISAVVNVASDPIGTAKDIVGATMTAFNYPEQQTALLVADEVGKAATGDKTAQVITQGITGGTALSPFAILNKIPSAQGLIEWARDNPDLVRQAYTEGWTTGGTQIAGATPGTVLAGTSKTLKPGKESVLAAYVDSLGSGVPGFIREMVFRFTTDPLMLTPAVDELGAGIRGVGEVVEAGGAAKRASQAARAAGYAGPVLGEGENVGTAARLAGKALQGTGTGIETGAKLTQDVLNVPFRALGAGRAVGGEAVGALREAVPAVGRALGPVDWAFSKSGRATAAILEEGRRAALFLLGKSDEAQGILGTTASQATEAAAAAPAAGVSTASGVAKPVFGSVAGDQVAQIGDYTIVKTPRGNFVVVDKAGKAASGGLTEAAARQEAQRLTSTAPAQGAPAATAQESEAGTVSSLAQEIADEAEAGLSSPTEPTEEAIAAFTQKVKTLKASSAEPVPAETAPTEPVPPPERPLAEPVTREQRDAALSEAMFGAKKAPPVRAAEDIRLDIEDANAEIDDLTTQLTEAVADKDTETATEVRQAIRDAKDNLRQLKKELKQASKSAPVAPPPAPTGETPPAIPAEAAGVPPGQTLQEPATTPPSRTTPAGFAITDGPGRTYRGQAVQEFYVETPRGRYLVDGPRGGRRPWAVTSPAGTVRQDLAGTTPDDAFRNLDTHLRESGVSPAERPTTPPPGEPPATTTSEAAGVPPGQATQELGVTPPSIASNPIEPPPDIRQVLRPNAASQTGRLIDRVDTLGQAGDARVADFYQRYTPEFQGTYRRINRIEDDIRNQTEGLTSLRNATAEERARWFNADGTLTPEGMAESSARKKATESYHARVLYVNDAVDQITAWRDAGLGDVEARPQDLYQFQWGRDVDPRLQIARDEAGKATDPKAVSQIFAVASDSAPDVRNLIEQAVFNPSDQVATDIRYALHAAPWKRYNDLAGKLKVLRQEVWGETSIRSTAERYADAEAEAEADRVGGRFISRKGLADEEPPPPRPLPEQTAEAEPAQAQTGAQEAQEATAPSPTEAATTPPTEPITPASELPRDHTVSWPSESRTTWAKPLVNQAKQAESVEDGVKVFEDWATTKYGPRADAMRPSKKPGDAGRMVYDTSTAEGRGWKNIDAEIDRFKKSWDQAPRMTEEQAAASIPVRNSVGGFQLADRSYGPAYRNRTMEAWKEGAFGGPGKYGGNSYDLFMMGVRNEDALDPTARLLLDTPIAGDARNLGEIFYDNLQRQVDAGLTGDAARRAAEDETMRMVRPPGSAPWRLTVQNAWQLPFRGLWDAYMRINRQAKGIQQLSWMNVPRRLVGDLVGNTWGLLMNGKADAIARQLDLRSGEVGASWRASGRAAADDVALGPAGKIQSALGLAPHSDVADAMRWGPEDLSRQPAEGGYAFNKFFRTAASWTGFGPSETAKRMVATVDGVGRSSLHASELLKNIDPLRTAFLDRVDQMAATKGVDASLLRDKLGDLFSPQDVRAWASKAGFASGDAERLARDWRSAVSSADRDAMAEVNRIFFSYRTTNVDEALNKVFFYHYWLSRASPLYLQAAIRSPAVMATYAHFTKGMQDACAQRDGQRCGYLKAFEMGSGLAVYFNPLYLLSTALIRFQPDFASSIDARGIDKVLKQTPAMLAPALQAGLSAIGLSSQELIDPIASYGPRRVWTTALNAAAARGLFGGNQVIDPTPDLWNRLVSASSTWFEENGLPFAKRVKNPAENRTAAAIIHTLIIQDIYAANGIPPDTDPNSLVTDPTKQDVVKAIDDALAAYDAGQSGNPYADKAFKQWAAGDWRRTTLATVFSGTTLGSDALDAFRAQQKADQAAGQVGSPAQNMMNLVNESGPRDVALQQQQTQYHATGTPLGQFAQGMYTAILNYKQGDILGPVTIGGQRWMPDDLAALPRDENDPTWAPGMPTRKLLATTYLSERGLLTAQQGQYAAQDAFKADPANAEYAGYAAWAKNARGIGMQELMRVSPDAYGRYIRGLPADIRNDPAKLDQAAFGMRAYEATEGMRSSLFTDKPGAAFDVSRANPVDVLSQASTGAQPTKTTKSPAQQVIEATQKWMVDSAILDLQLQRLTGNPNDRWDENQNPQLLAAMRWKLANAGISVPSKPRALVNYENWAAARQAGGYPSDLASYDQWYAETQAALDPYGVNLDSAMTLALTSGFDAKNPFAGMSIARP